MEIIRVDLIESGVKSITRREAEILHYVLQGKSNKEIAACLQISTATVQQHLKNAYRKLGVHNKIEALQKTKWMIQAVFGSQN